MIKTCLFFNNCKNPVSTCGKLCKRHKCADYYLPGKIYNIEFGAGVSNQVEFTRYGWFFEGEYFSDKNIISKLRNEIKNWEM